MNKAKKDILPIEELGKSENTEDQEFNNLIKEWTRTSRNILLMLNKKDQISTKKTTPKALMAFGAMGAHINMALQALKATELDI